MDQLNTRNPIYYKKVIKSANSILDTLLTGYIRQAFLGPSPESYSASWL